MKVQRILIDSLTEEQHQVMIGTLAGDGRLVKPYVSVSFVLEHGEAQLSYLERKVEVFANFPNSGVKPYKLKSGKLSYHCCFRSQPVFESYDASYYNSPNPGKHHLKKRITTEHVEAMGSLARAIWFLDDGSIQRNARRNDMAGFLVGERNTRDEHEILGYLNELYGPGVSRVLNRTSHYFIFSVEATQRLSEDLGPYIERFFPEKRIRKLNWWLGGSCEG